MIRNFIFHRVSPDVQFPDIEIDLAHFEKCIRYISRHYHVVLLEDLHAAIRQSDNKLPLVTISFDDGYLDNFTYAAPLLEKYGCRGTFFVVSQCIESQKPFWLHEIKYLFYFNDSAALNVNFNFLPEDLHLHNRSLGLKEKRNYFNKLKRCLKDLPLEEKDIVYEYFLQTLDQSVIPRLMMNWTELEELKARGHYIGAHSHKHNNLAKMTGDEELLNEFMLPKILIEKNLGHSPVSFAYPFGVCNRRVMKMAESAGYRFGVTADRHELYMPDQHDNFEIPRIALSNEAWWKTRLRITNKIENIKSILPRFFKKNRNSPLFISHR